MKIILTIVTMALMAVVANAQTKIAEADFTTATEFTGWAQFADEQTDGKVELQAGEGLAITVGVQTGQLWQPQIMVIGDGSFNLEEDGNYKVVVTAKFPTAGTLQINMGSWSANDQATFPVEASDDFQTIECDFEGWSVTAEGAHLLFQCGDFKGTTLVKSIEVYDMSADGEGGETVLYENDFTGIKEFTDWYQFDDSQTDGKVEPTADGLAITVDVPTGQLWQPQVMIVPDGSFNLEEDGNYKVVITAKFPTAGTLQINMGSWSANDQSTFPVEASNDFQTIECIFEDWSVNAEGAHLLFQCGDFKGTTIVKKIEICDMTTIDPTPVPTPVSTFYSGGIYYIIGENNTVSVTSGEVKYSGDVVIPSQVTYNGKAYNITSIGNDAFQRCPNLTSVTIPNSVTIIGEDVFYDCKALTSVNIPSNVTSIGRDAFMNCYSLNSITIPNSVTSIGSGAFSYCSGLTSIVSEIEKPFKIDSYVFFGISSDAELIVPYGTKAAYLATEGWNKFSRIIEISEPVNPNPTPQPQPQPEPEPTPQPQPQPEPVPTPNPVSTSRTIHVAAAGTLPNLISEDEKYQIEELVLTGELNGTDLVFIREMAGVSISLEYEWGEDYYDVYRYSTNGRLKFLNMEEAKIVEGGPAYNTNETHRRLLYVKSNTIPERLFFETNLKSIILPNSLGSIGERAFAGCTDLISISIPSNVTSIESGALSGSGWYNNQPNGALYLDNCMLGWKGDDKPSGSYAIKEGTRILADGAFSYCSDLTSVTIPNSVTIIGEDVFYDCKALTSVNIPNGVTSIGCDAFMNCYSLNSITIPNSVTSIGGGAFSYTGLTSIVSEIKNPFVINGVFDSDTYAAATLTIPSGTKSLYLSTAEWNKFRIIIEESSDEASFIIDGITYQGTKSTMSVVVKSVDKSVVSVEIPASVNSDGMDFKVTGIDNDVFKGSSMAALVWDVEAALPNNAFSNASISSNFLLYVKSAAYAPSTVKNVVVDGTAQTIVLSDNGGQFYCPQTFIARSISYTHNYTMETGKGQSKGWEALALPFFVQKINHSTRGEIVPFALFSSSSSQKPFWLAKYSGSGFKRTSAIEANEPYIIAMPNNSKYRNEYNLAGEVTFSAENAAVPKTPAFDGKFLPAFAPIAKSDAIMALNNSVYPGVYEPGSHFVKNLRDVHPFEAYMTGSSSSRGVIEINFDDGTTDMDDILLSVDDGQEVTIHNLSGQQVARTTQRDFDQVWQLLPKGVYIVNGIKMIK